MKYAASSIGFARKYPPASKILECRVIPHFYAPFYRVEKCCRVGKGATCEKCDIFAISGYLQWLRAPNCARASHRQHRASKRQQERERLVYFKKYLSVRRLHFNIGACLG